MRAEPRVARRVEGIRGLEFTAVPKPEVVTAAYLNGLAAREVQGTPLAATLAAQEAALRMLGLLDPDEELESILGSTGDVAAAAYDPSSGRLFVIADAVVANRALVDFVLAHELTHALEDQRFGLRRGARLDDDASLALTALYEGSATATMIDYARRHLSAADLLAASLGLDAGTGGVPRFYVDQLTWTYFGGARFVAGLRRLGGGSKLLDYALATRPPATTEQVLHVDKYVRAEPPLPVEVQTGALQERGWERADRGVIGELSTRQLLEVGADRSTAERAAAGWGGDSYELWRAEAPPAGCEDPCRGDLVLVAGWRMDTDLDAAELRQTLGTYLEDGLGGVASGADTWALEGGTAALRAAGDEVALVLAPDAHTAVAVAADQVAP